MGRCKNYFLFVEVIEENSLETAKKVFLFSRILFEPCSDLCSNKLCLCSFLICTFRKQTVLLFNEVILRIYFFLFLVICYMRLAEAICLLVLFNLTASLRLRLKYLLMVLPFVSISKLTSFIYTNVEQTAS